MLSFDKTNYFYFYNFQTGFVMYLALVIKIFGSHLIFLKIFEILFMSLTNVFVYKIASKVYTKKIGIISSIIYSLLFFNIAGSSIINNQHFSTLLVILSIYFFIKDKCFYYVLSGILVGIANIIRPSSIIILISFCLFLLWKLLINNFKTWKTFLIGFLLIILSAFSTMKIFDYSLLNLNVVPTSTLSSNAKYFKFVLGIHGNGIYNIPTETAEKTQVYFDLQKLNFDYELYNNECKNFIVNKFTQNAKETFGHIKNKMLVFCGEEDNQIGFSGNKVQNSKSYIFIKYYGYVQYFLLIVFSLLTVIINVKESKFYNTKNNLYQTQILFEIVFILYFCAHLLIEVQPRYRYDQYLMLAFIASPSIYLLFSIISSKYNKKDKEV